MSSNKKRSIVLIDDDDDDWVLFLDAIKEVDDATTCHFFMYAEDGIRFLVNSKQDLPDYIFLDLNMPRMDGKECLKEIKGQKELAHIPVVILTTSDSEEDVQEAKKWGASYFITKPKHIKLLRKALKFVFMTEDAEKQKELSNLVRVLK